MTKTSPTPSTTDTHHPTPAWGTRLARHLATWGGRLARQFPPPLSPRHAPPHSPPHSPRHLAPGAGLTPLILLTLLALPACDEVGTAYLIVAGPPKVPAVYELDPEATTTVLIEDRSEADLPSTALSELRRETDRLLIDKAKLHDIISGQSIARAAANGTDLPLAALGRSVGADVLIHVSLKRFAITPDGQVYQPLADFTVQVIDVDTGTRLWPAEGPPSSVRASQSSRTTLPPDPRRQTAAQVDAAKWTARVIAELFYEHPRAQAANQAR